MNILSRLAHLPTFLLLVGYPVYWLELYVFKIDHGQTSLLASVLFVIAGSAYILRTQYSKRGTRAAGELTSLSLTAKSLIAGSALLSLFILVCIFMAALLPPHLTQETDAMNYHITLPRQHLLIHSFEHLPWAADDLFLLPIQFALAPYWLVTTLPNKFPQFLFLAGLILTSIHLANAWGSKRILCALVVAFAVFGSHHLGIQMGTAMLDIVICYLFIAAIDSLLQGKVGLAIVEFTFLVWSKPLMPVQTALLAVLLLSVFFILRKVGWKTVRLAFDSASEIFLKKMDPQFLKKFMLGFALLSMAVAGPFIVKSFYHSGTPLFPLGPGLFKINNTVDYESAWGRSLKKSAEMWTNAEMRDQYGYGRSPVDFVKHFWLIAVPEKGVNNAFDYPVGLPYLLVLGPFIFLFWNTLRRREFAVVPWIVVLSWFLWWEGTQQSRYLYIPTVLMFITVLPQMKNYSKIFLAALLVALSLNALSIFRAHRHDLVRAPQAVLRDKDQMLVEMNRRYITDQSSDVVDLDFHDVAFAQFPVRVIRGSLPHTLALE